MRHYTRLLHECKKPADSYDVLGGLFEAMNTPEGVTGGRFKGVSYFNGGLFAVPARVELEGDEMSLLRDAAERDWSKVRPEIFGSLFERSLGAAERHAFGAHFTSAADIMKIVGPTIVDPWRVAIDSATTLKALRLQLTRIEAFTVLDPACGSGNFLYIAYRELKRLEACIYERMAHEFKSVDPHQRPFGFVTTRNFFGMDVNPFAVEIAKVTMMLAHKLAIDELHISESALPLDNLDGNIKSEDALIRPDGQRTPWIKADVIIGNPPFLGAKRLKPERGKPYVENVRRAYPDVPGMADYCVYWFRRAHDEVKQCTASDPVAGRVGLVGTQNIRNNASRVGGLDHIVATGAIVEAVDNQPWSGEAKVNVSIVNWVKTGDSALLPKTRRLWSRSKAELQARGRSAKKSFDLEFREVPAINASLSDLIDVSKALRLRCNRSPQRVFQGVTPGNDGFVLSVEEMTSVTTKDPRSSEVVFPYLIGRELVSGDGTPQRFIIDFGRRTIIEAMQYPGAFDHIKRTVLPCVMKTAAESNDEDRNRQLEKWWMHWRDRAAMKRRIRGMNGRYMAASRTQRWPFVFSFMASSVLPGDALQIFALDDDYSFGIVQSLPHSTWYKAKAARKKNEDDFNYSAESVFETFPWPQGPTTQQVIDVATAAREVRALRAATLPGFEGGLRGLYSSLRLPGKHPLRDAHAALV